MSEKEGNNITRQVPEGEIHQPGYRTTSYSEPPETRSRWQQIVHERHIDVITAIVITCATLVNVTVAVLQWGVAKSNTQQAVVTGKLDRRAWIVVDHITIDPLTPGKEPIIRYTFRNEGKTPAGNVKITADIFRTSRQPGQNDDEFGESASHVLLSDRVKKLTGLDAAPIAPGGQNRQSFEDDYTVSKEEIAQILAGQLRIYSFGTVTYGNPEDHYKTSYCNYVDATILQGKPSSQVNVGNCSFWYTFE